MATTSKYVAERDYIDNYAVKDFVKNNLLDKYFSDIDVSLRTVGMVGYTTELISNISEDAFNTGSVLFRETFPNRAQIPESIYSHAAIFQLSNVFSKASSCKFLLVLEENGILKNMVDDYDKDTGIFHFYIDKNTRIYVEDIIFTLDYDIVLNIVKKISEKGEEYLFTANYILEEYKNSISDLTNPYVKIRRSSDGYLALEVETHQCIREVVEDSLVSNSNINYPIIDVEYEGKLAGFDVLYREPKETVFIQLDTKIVYSQADQNPFCYYQMVEDGKIRISFNSKDNYFTPEFNSEIKVILYLTDGESGKFDVYNGTDIQLVSTNEKYVYANRYLVAAQPIGASDGGQDQMDIDALQQITVENYRTAMAITTEPDLYEFFNNYKYYYGDADVLFLKKRDDVWERVWSAFFILRKGDYIYNTNTLKLKLNLADLKNPEKNIFTLEPGYLFTANENDGYADFLVNEELNQQYYKEYLEAIEKGEIPYVEEIIDRDEIPAYLNRPASFAEFKKRHGLEDKITVFDLTEEEIEELDDPKKDSFLLMNPFLIRFKKEPNLVSTYLTFINNSSLMDFTARNDDCYVQFVSYILKVNRKFIKEKRYDIRLTLSPSIKVDDEEYPVVAMEEIKDEITGRKKKKYILGDKYSVINNDLRVIFVIRDKTRRNVCYTELYPMEYDDDSESFVFGGEIYTDDHLTSDSKIRLLDGEIYRENETDNYYKVYEDDNTLYNLYNKDGEIIATDIPVDDITHKLEEGEITLWRDVVNMSRSHDITVPMTDVECKVYTLYRRYYSTNDGKLVSTTKEMTNNIFSVYDKTLEGYIWTNEYTTATTPITFVEPLDSVRTYLVFEDFTECKEVENETTNEKELIFTHDIMDVEMFSLSMIRAKTLLDTELFEYFMNSFYAQYLFMVNIIRTRLRNATNIDVKLYNTYGRSRDFVIGEEGTELIDRVNLSIEFDMYFLEGTDLLVVTPRVKEFIKKEIEQINSGDFNNLFISNLMRKIETNFAYVDHIRFVKINDYDSTYQAVRSKVSDLNELTVEERRFYVPELLVCNVEDITINEYFTH